MSLLFRRYVSSDQNYFAQLDFTIAYQSLSTYHTSPSEPLHEYYSLLFHNLPMFQLLSFLCILLFLHKYDIFHFNFLKYHYYTNQSIQTLSNFRLKIQILVVVIIFNFDLSTEWSSLATR